MRKSFPIPFILAVFLIGAVTVANAHEVAPETEKFRQAALQNPNDADAHFNLGSAYAKHGQFQEAARAYQQVTRINPNDARAHLKLGDAYCDLGRAPEAIAAYEEALRINPRYADAYFSFGLAYSLLGRNEEAVDKYREVLRLDPQYLVAHYNLGVSYKKLRQYHDAVGAYQKALRINPQYADAHLGLGVVYGKLERHQDALREFREAVRIKPDYANAHLGLAMGYDLIGDGRNAVMQALKSEALYLKQGDVKGKFKDRKTLGITEARAALRQYYRKYGLQPEDFARIQIDVQPSTSLVQPNAPPPETSPALKTAGTGFVIGSSGYILTNYHVIKNAKHISIRFVDGETVTAKIAIKDEVNDIAFLKPQTFPQHLIGNISLGDSSKIKIGQKVFTIGFPMSSILGRQPHYAEGVVSSLSGVGDDPRAFQISIPIQPGNSGGPLFNEQGEVVGIVTYSLDAANTTQIFGAAPQNVNFAIKSIFIENLVPMLPEILISPTGVTPIPLSAGTSRSRMIERVKTSIVLIEVEN